MGPTLAKGVRRAPRAFRPYRRTPVSSEPTRDPRTDPLLTPANSALVVIDYQPNQINTVKSMDTGQLGRNIVSGARLGKTFGLPIVLSTVNAAAGQGATFPAI